MVCARHGHVPGTTWAASDTGRGTTPRLYYCLLPYVRTGAAPVSFYSNLFLPTLPSPFASLTEAMLLLQVREHS